MTTRLAQTKDSGAKKKKKKKMKHKALHSGMTEVARRTGVGGTPQSAQMGLEGPLDKELCLDLEESRPLEDNYTPMALLGHEGPHQEVTEKAT